MHHLNDMTKNLKCSVNCLPIFEEICSLHHLSLGRHLDHLGGQATHCLNKTLYSCISTGRLDASNVASRALWGVTGKVGHCQADLLKWRQGAPPLISKCELDIDETCQSDDSILGEPILFPKG